MVALMLPRCATDHRRDIQRYRGQEGSQIATLFERDAWFERSLGNAAPLTCIYWGVRCAWTMAVLEPRCGAVIGW